MSGNGEKLLKMPQRRLAGRPLSSPVNTAKKGTNQKMQICADKLMD